MTYFTLSNESSLVGADSACMHPLQTTRQCILSNQARTQGNLKAALTRFPPLIYLGILYRIQDYAFVSEKTVTTKLQFALENLTIFGMHTSEENRLKEKVLDTFYNKLQK